MAPRVSGTRGRGQGSPPAQRSRDACPSPLGRGRLGPGEAAGPGAGAAGRAPPLAGVRFTEQLPGRTRGGLTDAAENSRRLTRPVLTLLGRAMFARGSRRRRSGRAVSETQGIGGGVRGKLRPRRGGRGEG